MQFIEGSEYGFDKIKAALSTPLPPIEPNDLSGKIVIVTGANTGIGFETAKAIASMNPRKLILACRNEQKGNEALKSIKEATKFEGIEVWQLDLSSFANVRAFAARFLATGLPLDILVSNAGLGFNSEWVTTDDGYEIIIQVNHLANVLLVSELHPALKRAADARKEHNDHFPRVVVVASDVHFWAPYPGPDDPHPVLTTLKPSDPFIPQIGYFQSKLLNVLFAKEYAARCPDPIWICSNNPSYTQSELGKKDPKTGEAKEIEGASGLVPRTTYEGAKTIIFTSISPKVGASGHYYSDMGEYESRSTTRGELGKKFSQNVWNDTLDILKKHVPHTTIYDW